ncbi:MAG: histidine phosphatase family protein [Beijerinckiaceae bacterium]
MIPHTIFFIRHGETDWNAEGRMQGQKDIPLNELGRVQAVEAGQLLRGLHPQPDDLEWWVSPLGRTRETADLARNAIGLHPTTYKTDDRLKEITFGRWEGMTWKEIRRSDPGGAARRDKDKWGTVAPDGESYDMLAARVRAFLPTVRRDTVLVSHGGVGRVLMHILGAAVPAKVVNEDIWQGRVLIFREGRYDWTPE